MSDKKLKSVNTIENIDDNYDRDIEKGVGLLFRHFVMSNYLQEGKLFLIV